MLDSKPRNLKRIQRALTCLVIAGFACGCDRRAASGVTIPSLDGLPEVDPAVVQLIAGIRSEVAATPDNGLLWRKLGEAFEANDFLDRADLCYERAVKLADLDAHSWYRLAVVQYELGKPDAALKALERSIELYPTYGPAYWRRGFWLLDTGQPRDAAAAFKHALTINPADTCACLGLARARLETDQFDRALDALDNSSLRNSPNRAYAHHLRGLIFKKMNKPDDAAIELALGRGSAPVLADPWTLELRKWRRSYASRLKEAIQDVASGRANEAIRDLDALLRERPDDSVTAVTLAAAFLDQRDAPRAIEVLNKALEHNKDDHAILVNLAWAYAHTGNADEALRDADRATAVAPHLTEAYRVKAAVLFDHRRAADAIEALNHAIELDPADANLRSMRGLCLEQTSKPEEASADYRRAAESNAAHADAWLGLARCSLQLNRLDEAREALTWATRILGPRDPRVAELARQVGERADGASTSNANPNSPGR